MNTQRVTMVTGAASGIGYAAAVRLASRGDTVIGVDRDGERLSEFVARITSAGGAAHAITADLSVSGSAKAAVDDAVSRYGRLDVLVSSAGITRRHTVVDTTDAEWEQVISTTLAAGFRLARAAVPIMQEQGGGVIVIVASVWGIVAGPAVAAYAAAKGGLVNLARAMAIDHGPDGIRVNAVCPGDVDTPLMRREMSLVGDDPEATIPSSAQGRPIGRIGQPEDGAAAIEFLASDDAGYITGATLIMDGGWHAGG